MSDYAATKDTIQAGAGDRMLRDYTTTITILEHLSDAIFILNAEGLIEYANKVALDMLGLELNKLIGQNLADFLLTHIDFDDFSDHTDNNYLLENIYRGAFHELETALVCQEYKTPVVISFGLVRGNGGDLNYIIASAKDISIRKQLEHEMEQQQLLALSRDRYRELGELAVNMVHNLSQPVTSVRLSIELLQKQLERGQLNQDKTSSQFQHILSLLDAITENITSVRNFAFLTEDESLKPMQVQDVIHQAVQQVAYDLKEKNIEIKFDAAEKLPPVLANPLNIQQVFVSLIKFLSHKIKVNYASYQETKYAQGRIKMAILNKKNRWLHIVIKDASSYPEGSRQKSEGTAGDPAYINSHLELTVVQIILSSIGGDFKVGQDANSTPFFILRIPIDLAKERDQLLNLIELIHN